MEDLGRHRIGINQNQPHINADVASQKYNGTEGLFQKNARRFANLNLNLTNVIGVTGVTTGPLERTNCRVHLRGRCRDSLTDAVLTSGRFTRTVRPFVQKERSTEKNNLLLLDQKVGTKRDKRTSGGGFGPPKQPTGNTDDEGFLDHGKTANGNRYGNGTVIFGLLDGPEAWQRRTISTMAIGNPLLGMMADPERHARNSQLATCGTAARSAVAKRVP
ncbi:hypothetical protein GEV33_005703 [Tenebrio molitor]|uniref:Uncharacterized protein n=1 Tax=Tenebrio molitor TaxID=7067 RepID=A0A8J6LF53_TENMO|nr:hypothetical protein GEV33_005703 [Tenebrio molitor]